MSFPLEIPPVPRRYLTTVQAAEYLCLAPGTLRNWASANVGPRSVKAGNRRLYDISELDRWLSAGGKLTVIGAA